MSEQQQPRRRANAAPASPPLSLDEAMNFVAAHRVILCYDQRRGVAAWSPGKPLPMNLSRAIYRERTRLAAALRAGDARLCVVSDHRRYWRYAGNGRYYCEKCSELDAALDMTSA